jgi:hypothetical protein
MHGKGILVVKNYRGVILVPYEDYLFCKIANVSLHYGAHIN